MFGLSYPSSPSCRFQAALRRCGVGFVFVLSVAAAHGVFYDNLGTLTLCLDPDTVQVAVESADPVLDTLYRGAVAERLRKALSKTLTQYRVPFEEKASCADAAGYVYTLFYVHWLYPEQEEPRFVYAATLQVGAFLTVTPDPETALPDERFYAYTAAQLLESDLDEPFQRLLPADNEQMITELATAWWDDRSYQQELRQARQRALLLRLSWLSGGVTLGILLFGLFLRRRRKHSLSA